MRVCFWVYTLFITVILDSTRHGCLLRSDPSPTPLESGHSGERRTRQNGHWVFEEMAEEAHFRL